MTSSPAPALQCTPLLLCNWVRALSDDGKHYLHQSLDCVGAYGVSRANSSNVVIQRCSRCASALHCVEECADRTEQRGCYRCMHVWKETVGESATGVTEGSPSNKRTQKSGGDRNALQWLSTTFCFPGHKNSRRSIWCHFTTMQGIEARSLPAMLQASGQAQSCGTHRACSCLTVQGQHDGWHALTVAEGKTCQAKSTCRGSQ